MERQSVASSNIASIGYDAAKEILEIEFNHGGIYQYFDVPENVYDELMNASSHGQYCSHAYVKLLQDYDIKISMTENGDPLENAIAERVNGIIKGEYLENYEVENINQAKKLLKAVVDLYNNERPHMSIGNLTPNKIHQSTNQIKIKKLWKNYYQKKPILVNEF